MEDNCIFCKIVSGEAESEKVGDSENFIVIKNKFPLTSHHLLILSKKHYKNTLDLPGLAGNELISVIKEQTIKLMKDGCVGVKVVQNNGKFQEIPHFHVHLIGIEEGEKPEKFA